MRRGSFLISMIVIAVFLFCACGSLPDEKEELNIAIIQSPTTADPQLCYDSASATALAFCTGKLYEYDRNGELIPCLAESYELSEDGCTYTFHLKEGLKWSDGSPMTADDFAFGIQRLADPDTGSNAVYLLTESCTIKNAGAVTRGEMPVSSLGVYASDDKTLVIELEAPCAFFCSLLTKCNFAPCSRDFFSAVGNDYASSADTVLYSGPYIMDRYEPLAKQIHYVPNPYYTDAEKISLKGVTLQVVTNVQQAIMCYRTGDMDVTPVNGDYMQLAEGDPELQVFPKASSYFIFLNQQKCPELKNKNIRMALSKSIDRKSLTDNVLGAGTTSLYSLIPQGFYKETGGSDFEADKERYKDLFDYDPEEAKMLWEKGLSELGLSGFSLEYMYASNRSSVAEATAAQMKDTLPGLDIKLKPVPFKEYVRLQSSGDFELCFSAWIADYIDPTSFLALFLSTGGSGYYDPQYDALFQRIQSSECVMDPVIRDSLMHEAEDMIMEDAGMIPIYTEGNTFLVHKGVINFYYDPMGLCMAGELAKEAE